VESKTEWNLSIEKTIGYLAARLRKKYPKIRVDELNASASIGILEALKIYKKQQGIKKPPTAWLFWMGRRIAQNNLHQCCLLRTKKQAYALYINNNSNALLENTISNKPSPAEAVELDEVRQLVEDPANGTLSYAERKVLHWVFWDGKTLKGIAKETSISRTYLQVTYQQALLKLKKILS